MNQSPIQQSRERHPTSWSSPLRNASRFFGSARWLRGREQYPSRNYKVLLVESINTKKKYALKVINIDAFEKKEIILQQLNQEKSVLESLKPHPHIVTLHNSWTYHDALYLLLEYIPGKDVFTHVQRRKRITPKLCARYVLQMAMALDYLHSQDVLFRDLKLENVIINAITNCAVLTDFGLVKRLPLATHRTNTICGTIQYMAPEMLRGDSYGISVDWWCLGVMAYAMLCGRYPFNSGFGKLHLDHSLNDRQIMLKRIELGELPFPSFIPFAAEVVVRKLLDIAPCDRISSYNQLEPMKWFEYVSVDPATDLELADKNLASDDFDENEIRSKEVFDGFTGSYLEHLIFNNEQITSDQLNTPPQSTGNTINSPCLHDKDQAGYLFSVDTKEQLNSPSNLSGSHSIINSDGYCGEHNSTSNFKKNQSELCIDVTITASSATSTNYLSNCDDELIDSNYVSTKNSGTNAIKCDKMENTKTTSTQSERSHSQAAGDSHFIDHTASKTTNDGDDADFFTMVRRYSQQRCSTACTEKAPGLQLNSGSSTDPCSYLERTKSARAGLFEIILMFQGRQLHEQRSPFSATFPYAHELQSKTKTQEPKSEGVTLQQQILNTTDSTSSFDKAWLGVDDSCSTSNLNDDTTVIKDTDNAWHDAISLS